MKHIHVEWQSDSVQSQRMLSDTLCPNMSPRRTMSLIISNQSLDFGNVAVMLKVECNVTFSVGLLSRSFSSYYNHNRPVGIGVIKDWVRQSDISERHRSKPPLQNYDQSGLLAQWCTFGDRDHRKSCSVLILAYCCQ